MAIALNLEIPISDRLQLDEIEKLKQELKDIERSQIEHQEELTQYLSASLRLCESIPILTFTSTVVTIQVEHTPKPIGVAHN